MTGSQTFDEPELVDLVLAVASGGMSKRDLIEVFESRCHPIGGGLDGCPTIALTPLAQKAVAWLKSRGRAKKSWFPCPVQPISNDYLAERINHEVPLHDLL
jgi:hypothetical protein